MWSLLPSFFFTLHKHVFTSGFRTLATTDHLHILPVWRHSLCSLSARVARFTVDRAYNVIQPLTLIRAKMRPSIDTVTPLSCSFFFFFYLALPFNMNCNIPVQFSPFVKIFREFFLPFPSLAECRDSPNEVLLCFPRRHLFLVSLFEQ